MQALILRFRSTLGQLAQNRFFFPVFLLLVGVVSFLLQINRMGFYWDDWQAVFLSRSSDPSLVWRYFFYDRPFSAWTYAVTIPLLQMHAPLWQVLTLLLRWAGVLFIYWTLVEIWPDWKTQSKWVAILILVYPTFTMQSMAVAFSQHFITFALSTLSLFLMVYAWNHRRFFWIVMPLAWVACGVSLFSMEYFVGLEALRYVLLGMLIFHSWTITRSGLRSFVLAGLPFILILGVYLYYRLVLYPAQLGSIQANYPSLLLSGDASLLTRLASLSIKMGQDILYLLFGAWAGIITEINVQSKAFILGWVLGILTAGLVFFFFSPKGSPSEPDTPRPPYKKLWLGLFIILVAGLPVWSLGQQITIGKWSGRYSLAPMIGAAIVVVWLVERLIRTRLQRNILLAVLMAFSIATQVQSINLYRKDWEVQRKLYWQLTWRAPALKDGTAVFAPGVSPLSMEGEYQIWYALNSLYHPENAPEEVPIGFFTFKELGTESILAQGQPLLFQIRNLTFNGNTSQAIAYYFDPGQGCLRVFDSIYSSDPTLPEGYSRLFPISNISQILPEAQSQPLKQVFGLEPSHDWCYTFEKADLARQQGDWQTILDLAGETGPAGLHPLHGVEVAPFLQAFSRSGHWDWVLETSRLAVQTTPGLENWICAQWDQLAPGSDGLPVKQQIWKEFGCKIK
jgi:hypothetical protein